MWQRVRRWLRAIPLNDPVEYRVGLLLQVVLLGIISILILASLINLLSGLLAFHTSPYDLAGSALNLLAVLVFAAPLGLLRYGRFGMAIQVAMADFLLLAAVSGIFGPGLDAGGVMPLVLVVAIALAGLLLGPRWLLLTYGVSVAMIAVAAQARQRTAPQFEASSVIFNFALLGGLLALFLNRFGSVLRELLAATLLREQQLEREIAARAQAEERGSQSEARLRALIENASEAIWSIDRERILLAFNEVFRTQFVDIFGRAPLAGDIVPTDTFWDGLYSRALAGERFTVEHEYMVAGASRNQAISLNPIYSGAEVAGVAIFSRDITERKRLEAQLLQSQKLESIGRLAGGVAHDFNNLLTAIIGNTDLARDGLAADHPARAEIAEIARAAERAAGLTRQLLAFARRQIIEPRVIDLNELILDIDALLRRLIGEDIALETLPALGLWSVRADPGQIEQVIVNLAVNARDAMPHGGKLTIETGNVTLDQDYANQHFSVVPGSYVLLAISDTGVGMDNQVRAQIFEPFFTTKEQGRGTGLGLAMCYGIVKQHGGSIWVYSEPRHGTSFRIYLPRADEPAERLTYPDEPRAAPRGAETILLVEDEAAVRRLAARVLREHGYTVFEAAHPGEALAIAGAHPAGSIQLLLTDVVMPGMSGKELAEKVLKHSPEIKTLFISGYTNNAIVHHGRLDLGVAFLPKPFSPATLARKVRETLDS